MFAKNPDIKGARLYVWFLNPPWVSGAQVKWLWCDGKNNQHGQQVWSEFDATLLGVEEFSWVGVFIPSEHVLSCFMDSAANNLSGHNQRQIVTYELEDQLLDEVDDVHVALPQKHADSSNSSLCMVIGKALLRTYLEEIEKKSLSVNWMVPDYLLLPPERGCSTHVDQEKRLLFRMANDKGGAMPADWGGRIGSTESLCSPVPNEFGDGSEDRLLMRFCAEQQAPVFNLLQGDFRPESRRVPFWRSWYLYGAALVMASLLVWGGVAIAGFRYQQSALAFERATEQLYSQYFPDEPHGKNMRQRVLMRLRSLEELQQPGFMDYFGALYLALQSTPATTPVVIQSLRYDDYNGVLVVELIVEKVEMLEQFKEILNQAGYLRTKVDYANQTEDGIQGRLRVSR